MLSLSKMMVLFSVALSVAAIPNHIARNSHGHRDIAARVAAPEPAVQPVEVVENPVVRPQNRRRMKRANGRCPPVSSSVPPSSSTPEVHSNIEHLPESSSTPKPQPQSSSTPKPKPSSTSANPPKNTGSSSSGSSALDKLLSQTFTGGDGTYYATGLGACGIVNKDTDFIAAVSMDFFDTFPGYTGANPNNNGLCGRKVSVEYQGKTITVTLTDRCTGCAYSALDFSPAAFDALADPAVGRIHDLTWRFI